MNSEIEEHYSASGELADRIAAGFERVGKSLNELTTADLAAVDEFHIRGRKATLEIGVLMDLTEKSTMLDLGSGLGGPARTLAETYDCKVQGIDLTKEFCDAANTISAWLGLDNEVGFTQGDATDLPYPDEQFDAAMTIHVAMNIAAKDRLYSEARRIVKPGGRFAVYDVIQGDGGDIHFPLPWAREASISHLSTQDEMESLLSNAGFKTLDTHDSSDQSLAWFQEKAKRLAETGPPPVSFQMFFGEEYPEMVRNQVRNLAERRIRTFSLVCER